uniref:Uncharacterized protein n=1 Tax=Panagrolaimus davidi TaxID=227884 RepID=A0A914P410_9BILA
MNEDLQKGKSDSTKNEKQIFTAETFVFQNSFEFPRQENERAKVPEVSNFKASQRLLKMDARFVVRSFVQAIRKSHSSPQQGLQLAKFQGQTPTGFFS